LGASGYLPLTGIYSLRDSMTGYDWSRPGVCEKISKAEYWNAYQEQYCHVVPDAAGLYRTIFISCGELCWDFENSAFLYSPGQNAIFLGWPGGSQI